MTNHHPAEHPEAGKYFDPAGQDQPTPPHRFEDSGSASGQDQVEDAGADTIALEALRRQQKLALDAGHYPETASKARLLSERRGASRVSSFRKSSSGKRRRGVAPNDPDGSHMGLATSKLGTGPSRFDPQPLERVLGGIVNRLGWSTTLNIATISARWPTIVGPAVAQHCIVETFEDNVLVVRTSSTAWANQMRILLPTLEKQIAEAFGQNAVKHVVIRGPEAPSWRKGKFHVPGRGPRDTYG